MTDPLLCPRCGKPAEKHCNDTQACDVFICRKCEGIGTLDGKRWATFKPKA